MCRIIAFIFFMMSMASLAFGTVIHVPADQPSIQAGINAAVNGDTVLVADSTYFENINFKGKAITVASLFIMDGDTNHINNTIIDGSQPSNPDSGSVVSFVSGEDTTSVLYGFTITGGSGTLSPSPNQSTRRGGGVLCYQSGARIEYNIIENNECVHQLYAYGGGICEMNVSSDPHLSYVIVENNKIRNNRCETNETNANGGGIYFRGEGRIDSNHIVNNEVEFDGAAVSNGACFGGGVFCGWWEAGYAYAKIFNNIIANNRALSNNPLGGGYGGGVDLIYTICDFQGNTVKDSRVSGAPWAIGGGMRILFSLLPANVSENNFINNGPLDPSITVIGGGLLTVQTENLNIEKNLYQFNSGQYGGGIYLSEDIHVSVRNNMFLQNDVTDYGGGIVIDKTSPLVENNLVAGNIAWGGGGIAVSSSGENSYDKSLGDLQMMLSGGLGEISDDNIFQSPLKKNTTVVAEPLIINNTIVNNTATAQGGGIYNEISQPTVLNTILWGNIAAQDSQLYSTNGTFLLGYSDIQDWDTTNNTIIDVDPFFVMSDTLYHLSDSSACINVGIDSMLMGGIMCYCPPDDYEGDQRPHPGTKPDIGADETDIVSGIEPVSITTIPKYYNLYQNYPNPFNPSTTIEFALPTPGFVTLSIFNILGEKVATLVSEELVAGNYKYHWDAKRLTSGVYLYKLEAGNIILVRKMILLR